MSAGIETFLADDLRTPIAPARTFSNPDSMLEMIRRGNGFRDWLRDPTLRRRVTAGLNKGEAHNAMARAVCFNRLGEIRDRSFENQRHRASGLNLIVAAITLWNTIYLERAASLLAKYQPLNPSLLQHVSPLGWEHVNLTGDYTWHSNKRVAKGGFRPLRIPRNGFGAP